MVAERVAVSARRPYFSTLGGVTSVRALETHDLRAFIVLYRDTLRLHQAALNRLNVYPVPDGDTGTNMALTLESVVKDLDKLPNDAEFVAVCGAISQGSLMGARGNSGVILSQILRGLVKVFREAFEAGGEVDGPVLVAGLRAASVAADEAVMRPVEGTILSVARGVAVGAEEALATGATSFHELCEKILVAANVALAFTPEQLPILKAAGVVDAGGSGFVLLLESLAHVLTGSPVSEPAPEDQVDVVEDFHERVRRESGVEELRYEVMYFLEAPDALVPAFKDVWATLGDSIVVVGGDGIWNCHIHTDDIGATIEAAIDIGRPRTIRVTDLLEQVAELHAEERWVAEQTPELIEIPTSPVETAVVAVGAGAGIARLLRSMGAQAVVSGGQSMNPSTQDLLDAVEAVASQHVVILPNNKNIIPVARQVDALTSKTVVVIPTRAVVEGLAALVAYDPDSDVESNTRALTDAASATVVGEVTTAVRDAPSDAGPIASGDFLGIGAQGIVTIGADLGDVTCRLLATLISPNHEILTMLEGDGSSAATTRHVTEWLAAHHPSIVVETHHGGQPLYPYWIGLE